MARKLFTKCATVCLGYLGGSWSLVPETGYSNQTLKQRVPSAQSGDGSEGPAHAGARRGAEAAPRGCAALGWGLGRRPSCVSSHSSDRFRVEQEKA